MEVNLPLNFQQPRLGDGSYVIFVGARQKLRNFQLLIFNGQVPTEDKIKLMKNVYSIGFALSSIGPWPLEVQQFPVVFIDY
jgi:hypothetical protein